MCVQPGAEPGISNSQGLAISNVFCNLAQDDGHAGKNKKTYDQMQTEISFFVANKLQRI